MARKKKTETETKAPVQPSEVKQAINATKLKALLKAKRAAIKDTAEIAGTLGQAIARAVEKDHLHRKAFTVVSALDRMEPEKLADFLDHFEHYLEISGLNARAKQVQRLGFGKDEGAEEDDEGEDDRETGNVSAFPRQGSVAAE